jgi:WG containing repeat
MLAKNLWRLLLAVAITFSIVLGGSSPVEIQADRSISARELIAIASNPLVSDDPYLTEEGYIDRSGKMVIKAPPNNHILRGFSEGLAAIRMLRSSKRDDDYGLGYIDRNGKIVIPPNYLDTPELQGAENFHEGLAAFAVDVKTKTLYGYLDKRGKVAIPARFAKPGIFEDGIALVATSEQLAPNETMRYVFINNQGKILFDEKPKTFTTTDYSVFSEGLAPVMVGEQWGFINRQGLFAVPPTFRNFRKDTRFQEGLAPVSSEICRQIGNSQRCETKYGYIDGTGKFEIAPRFDEAHLFSEGLATVRIGNGVAGKWGYIDHTGKFIIPPQFAEPLSGDGQFHEGLANVRGLSSDRNEIGNSYMGYIDRTGKFVIPPNFYHGSSFYGGLAHVIAASPKANAAPSEFPYKEGQRGYIDRQGKFVWTETNHSTDVIDFSYQ